MTTKKRVLIVDDSVVFRTQLKVALEAVPELEIGGAAGNGKIALQKLDQEKIDLVILDLEMPEMNGLEFLKQIQKRTTKPSVIVFSSLSATGAAATLEALRLGASDYVLKPNGDVRSIEDALVQIRATLVPKILQFIKGSYSGKGSDQSIRTELFKGHTNDNVNKWKKIDLFKIRPQVLVIASSTGGPPTLEKIFSVARGPFRIPILIAQHMPPVFTKILADRITALSGIETSEAKQNAQIFPNKIYIAPGDYHLVVERREDKLFSILNQAEQRNYVRPAADFLFESVASIFGAGCVGMVLTGMGSDGRDGAVSIKNNGGAVFIQDKESSQVWGMPSAVFDAGAFDSMGSIEDCARLIQTLCKV